MKTTGDDITQNKDLKVVEKNLLHEISQMWVLPAFTCYEGSLI